MEASSWKWLTENIVHSCIDLFLIYKAEVAITSFWSNSHLILRVKTVCIHPLNPLLPKPTFLVICFFYRLFKKLFLCVYLLGGSCCLVSQFCGGVGILCVFCCGGGGGRCISFNGCIEYLRHTTMHCLKPFVFFLFSVKLNHDSYHLQRWNQYADKRLVLHQTLIQDVTTTRPAHKLYMIGITGCASK